MPLYAIMKTSLPSVFYERTLLMATRKPIGPTVPEPKIPKRPGIPVIPKPEVPDPCPTSPPGTRIPKPKTPAPVRPPRIDPKA